MKGKFRCLAAALLPVCFLSAQQPAPQNSPQTNPRDMRLPSPEVMRHVAELRQRMSEHAIAINDLAGHIQSLDDARKLVNMVADEFSDGLPPKWATHSIRERIARAEYESATEPGSLIPEQHIADVWNDFLEKIGAPRETMLNAAEIHYLRDGQCVSARTVWAYNGGQQIWTIPAVFAVGPDGRVANGSRALEAIRLLWLLARNTDDFAGIHAQAQKGVLLSDLISQPEKPTASVAAHGFVTARIVSFPVQQAAFRYVRDHGDRALNRAIEEVLKNLLNG